MLEYEVHFGLFFCDSDIRKIRAACPAILNAAHLEGHRHLHRSGFNGRTGGIDDRGDLRRRKLVKTCLRADHRHFNTLRGDLGFQVCGKVFNLELIDREGFACHTAQVKRNLGCAVVTYIFAVLGNADGKLFKGILLIIQRSEIN